MKLELASRTRLNDGVEIPLFGLGVYLSAPGDETYHAVRAALDAGYRLIDTARAYRNEKDVGRAIRDSGIPREQLFITTKLWNSDHGYDSTLRACRQSLSNLGLEQLDLYLIHWPVEQLRHDTWRAFVALREQGLVRSIGVSNYTIRHLGELLERSPVAPSVNQVEYSPFLNQEELLAFCRQKAIQIEAYGPLTQGLRLQHPALLQVAKKQQKTGAQVLLRWGLERGLIVIPKSVKKERILENAAIYDFELDATDLGVLNHLDEGLRTSWDPTNAP
jgi:diketogulonate reductase-like aldo/keto reductase